MVALEAHAGSILLARAHALLSQDQSQFYALQEDAMKSFGTFEIEQDVWLNQFNTSRSFGQKAADKVALVGGSWKFVICLISAIAGWAVLNSVLGPERMWDPYPFILMNLFLSMIASLQVGGGWGEGGLHCRDSPGEGRGLPPGLVLLPCSAAPHRLVFMHAAASLHPLHPPL